MRIISKVRDYYDCGQAYGQDPELIYLRRPGEYILLAGNQWIDRLEDVRKSMPKARDNPTVGRFIIGFCGKTYPGYTFHWHGMAGDKHIKLERILYHPDDFKALFKYKVVQKAFPKFFERRKGRLRYWQSRFIYNMRYEDVVQSYEANFGSDKFYDLFTETNSPIWIYHPALDDRCNHPRRKGTFIKLNDRLAGYDFVRILDPYTAYQELSMFVGNNLQRKEPIMASVSDASMLKKKGFHEYSFKTRPKEDKP